jgi:glyceraldehyde-3-phosphate dehydrogenase/erythrose-4-phosphate dehydrogenase
MVFARLILATLVAFTSLQAHAQRVPVPIVNHEKIAVELVAGKKLTAAEVKAAIVSAPAPRPWEFSERAPGQLIATLNVRGKHTVVANITYTADHYSITYRDSINMKYAPSGGSAGVIHPFYNQWIDELRAAIRLQLTKI